MSGYARVALRTWWDTPTPSMIRRRIDDCLRPRPSRWCTSPGAANESAAERAPYAIRPSHDTMKIAIVVAVVVVAVLAVVALTLLRKAGYRGAVGFKNRHASELAAIRLTGFSEPVDCRTLARGEHSFNFVERQHIPAEVQIVWRFISDAAEKTARISLTDVPKDAVTASSSSCSPVTAHGQLSMRRRYSWISCKGENDHVA
jgi:hypothetical protein